MKKQTELTNKKKSKKWLRNAALISAGVGAFAASGWSFFHFIVYAGRKKKPGNPGGTDSKNRKQWFQLKHTTINHPKYKHEQEYEEAKEWCREQPMEDWYIHTEDGLTLHASFLASKDPKRAVLLAHGYRGTRFGSVAYMARFLHEDHTDILFIDQRCCGESEGKYITFGAKEHQDILRWVELLNEQENGKRPGEKKIPIYLYGQSMGAASVILAAGEKLPEEVRGIIAECGFHSMKQQLRDIASGWFKLPRIELLLLQVDLFCRIFAGFKMKDTDTTKALLQNTRPVLFFHGELDTYVWPENSRKNFRLCRAPKRLVMMPDARHSCCSYEEPERFGEELTRFFKRNDGPSI